MGPKDEKSQATVPLKTTMCPMLGTVSPDSICMDFLWRIGLGMTLDFKKVTSLFNFIGPMKFLSTLFKCTNYLFTGWW
jgi:hypothetical protein